MPAMKNGQFRKRLIVIATASVIAAAQLATSSLAATGSSSAAPAGRNKEIRKQQEKQFMLEHSDASGKPRPDLWRKGVEQQKQMQVAPYIGWHPPTSGTGKPTPNSKNQ